MSDTSPIRKNKLTYHILNYNLILLLFITKKKRDLETGSRPFNLCSLSTSFHISNDGSSRDSLKV